MKRIIWFLFIYVALTNAVFGQPKEITRDESVQALVDGFIKFNDFSWRKKQKIDYFDNGKLVKVKEEIEERIKPDKIRFLTIEQKGKIVDRSEAITIGEKTYCRQNKRAWKKSEDCSQDGFVAVRGETIDSKYTVEETKLNDQKVKLFHQYETFSNENGLNYSDYKFWINEDGFLIQREMENGLVESKKVLSRLTETKQVDPKDLKIEAPIK